MISILLFVVSLVAAQPQAGQLDPPTFPPGYVGMVSDPSLYWVRLPSGLLELRSRAYVYPAPQTWHWVPVYHCR